MQNLHWRKNEAIFSRKGTNEDRSKKKI